MRRCCLGFLLIALFFTGCSEDACFITDPIWMEMVGGASFIQENWGGALDERGLSGNIELFEPEEGGNMSRRLADLVMQKAESGIQEIYLSPLLSPFGFRMAIEYPDLRFIAVDSSIKPSEINTWSIYSSSEGALTQLAEFLTLLQQKKKEDTGQVPVCGGLLYQGIEDRRSAVDKMLERYQSLTTEPFYTYDVRDLESRDLVRRNTVSARNSGVDILLVYLSELNLYAMNQLTDQPILLITEELGVLEEIEDQVLLSLETDYSKLLETAVSMVETEDRITVISRYLRPGPVYSLYAGGYEDLNIYWARD